MKVITDLVDANKDAAKVAGAVVAVGLVAALVKSQLGAKKNGKAARKEYLRPASTLPVVGNMLDMAKNHDRFYDWLTEVSEGFNNEPWVMTIPGRSLSLVISTPAHMEEVMKTKEDIFQRGPESHFNGFDMFGNGISTTDGDAWYFHRKTASNLFSMQMLKDVMQDIVREKLAVLVKGINGYIDEGKQVSLMREMGHFTMDVFTKIGFGVELNNLETGFADPKGSSRFNEAFDLAMATIVERVQTPQLLWRFKRFFDIGTEKVFRENMAIINGLVYDVINKSMEMKRNNDTAGLAKRKDLVSLFIESKLGDSDVTLEDDDATIMRDMVVNFIIAGKDTSSLAMCWFAVHMNRHPEVLAKIRQEMQEKVPGLITGDIQVPTVAQISELVYLEAAIRESIRIYPSTNFVYRQPTEDVVLHDGTFVEKGMGVMIANWVNSRNKQTWGPDAHVYKPERWIDPDTGKLIVVSPFQFSSFGSGQHICLGQKFALMEIKLAMATLWSKFDFTTVEKPEEITYEFALTISPKGPLFCNPSRHEAARAAA
jgi:cytochrome P450